MAKDKLSCLIIEDEPIAAEVLKDYIDEVSFLDLKGICKDAIYALEKLKTESIDVIFLDIHLPKLKGLAFLSILKDKPQTILTTAYHQYALDAFDADVVDYLLKPIEFSRFLLAVNKLKQPEKAEKGDQPNDGVSSNDFHFFNVNKKRVKVYYNDILYIESLKDYSRIHTRKGSLVTRGHIGNMESFFSSNNFLRIHRSYIIAIDKIRSFSASEIEVNDVTLPIGRSYKVLVAKALSEFGV